MLRTTKVKWSLLLVVVEMFVMSVTVEVAASPSEENTGVGVWLLLLAGRVGCAGSDVCSDVTSVGGGGAGGTAN